MIIHICRPVHSDNLNVGERLVRAAHDLGHSVHDFRREISNDTIYEKVELATKSIEKSDIIIAECSGDSVFSAGYEVALALQSRKPTLLLVGEGAKASSYAAGIKSDFITLRTYNDQTLERMVKDFMKENEMQTKDLRFNFVIDRKIYNHLRLRSFKSGKTKAEIVRDLLLKDLEGDQN